MKSGEIAIPEIQRPFVWDATKVRNLLDSLYRGYPVGYLWARTLPCQNPACGTEIPLMPIPGWLKKTRKKLPCAFSQTSTLSATFWQRNYDEHIISNDHSLQRIREYISTNTLRWHLDRENVHATGTDPMDEEWFG